MRKTNSSGSMGPLAIGLTVLGAIIIIGLAILLLAGGGDETATDENTAASGEQVSDQVSPAADNGDAPASQAPASQTTASGGDYTITKVWDLSPICASNSFPSGVVSTPSGKVTAAFLERGIIDGDYKYLHGLSLADSSLAPDNSDSNAVDLVACISPTETESFRVSCPTSGEAYDLVGYELDMTLYNIQSKQQVGSSKLSYSRDCPLVALTIDGEFIPTEIDMEELVAHLNGLSL